MCFFFVLKVWSCIIPRLSHSRYIGGEQGSLVIFAESLASQAPVRLWDMSVLAQGETRRKVAAIGEIRCGDGIWQIKSSHNSRANQKKIKSGNQIETVCVPWAQLHNSRFSVYNRARERKWCDISKKSVSLPRAANQLLANFWPIKWETHALKQQARVSGSVKHGMIAKLRK